MFRTLVSGAAQAASLLAVDTYDRVVAWTFVSPWPAGRANIVFLEWRNLTAFEVLLTFPHGEEKKAWCQPNQRLAIENIRFNENGQPVAGQEVPYHTVNLLQWLNTCSRVSYVIATEHRLIIKVSHPSRMREAQHMVIHVLQDVFRWQRRPIVTRTFLSADNTAA